MSTILDALKRSEQERKVNNVPILSDMPAPQERARWPLIFMCVITLLLFAVLTWMLLVNNPQSSTPQEVVISNETVTSATGQEAVNESGLLAVSVISYADEPSARFVMINAKLFREGDFVMAGVKVESILKDSVVLIERGKRVTRQP